MKKTFLSITLSSVIAISSITSVFANNNDNIENQLEIVSNFSEENNVGVYEEQKFEESEKEDTSLKLKNTIEIDKEDNIKVELQKEKVEFSNNSRIAGSHTPNDAFYLPQHLFNKKLNDTIGREQNWYYFDINENSKISLTLQMPQNSEYDLRLYKYNAGTLELVSFSEYYGTYEHLSYIAEPGIYYFAILPFSPVNNGTFSFVLDSITNYDQSEPDDNIWFAKQYANNINVEQTLDNVFDEDFFKLDITQEGRTFIRLRGISPIDSNEYSIGIYDKNLNLIRDNFPLDTYYKIPLGTYYVRVKNTNTSFDSPKKYSLNINTVLNGDFFKYSAKGDSIVFNDRKISINGKTVPIYWEYNFQSIGYPYYRRVHRIKPLLDNSADPLICSLEVGTFSGRGDSHTDNAIFISLSNVYVFSYFYKVPGIGTNTKHKDYRYPAGFSAVIDANTGKILDASINTAYSGPEEFKGFFIKHVK